MNPLEGTFHSFDYIRHNARRLEHLATLNLPIAGRTVLEVGAGIGDHSSFYIDRGCRITITEARPDNIGYLKSYFPSLDIRILDLDNPVSLGAKTWEIVHAYGILYHLANPESAIRYLSTYCSDMLFLETCVNISKEDTISQEKEKTQGLETSISGNRCDFSRAWVFNRLKENFEHVYLPRTQPFHVDFPIDWNDSNISERTTRAIFIASRCPIDNDLLVSGISQEQTR